MLSKEEIFNQVKSILVEMFGFAPEAIRPETQLVEELDFDSIDALNLSSKLDSVFDQKLGPQTFRDIHQVQDVVNTLAKMQEEA